MSCRILKNPLARLRGKLQSNFFRWTLLHLLSASQAADKKVGRQRGDRRASIKWIFIQCWHAQNWERPARNPGPCHQFVYNLTKQRWKHIKSFVSNPLQFNWKLAQNGYLTDICCGNCLLKLAGVQIESSADLGSCGKAPWPCAGCRRF